MSSFGESLRDRREARNLSIEELSIATGILLDYLQALERNEFHTLPGPAFGKLYIRAYAEVLKFDPRALIDAYVRALKEKGGQGSPAPRAGPDPSPRPIEEMVAQWRQSAIAQRNGAGDPGASIETTADETRGDASKVDDIQQVETIIPEVQDVEAASDELLEVEELPDETPVFWEAIPADDHDDAVAMGPVAAARTGRSHRPVIATLGIIGLLLGAAGIFIAFFSGGAEAPGPSSAYHVAPQASRGTPPPTAAPKPPSPSSTESPPVPSTGSPGARRAIGAAWGATMDRGALSVTESGMGRRIVNHRLEGQGEPFAQGETAWFSTRVVGGSAERSIRHVWLYEGRTQQSILLRLGGPDWRTRSRKTLGRAGQWIVEARDEAGNVLARATFECSPARH